MSPTEQLFRWAVRRARVDVQDRHRRRPENGGEVDVAVRPKIPGTLKTL